MTSGALPPAETFIITRAIRHYFPGAEIPETAPGWVKMLCPFHGDTRMSAAISYELDSFSCLACGVAGNTWTLVLQMEESNYAATKRITEGLAAGSDRPLPPSAGRKPSRRVFGEPRADGGERSGADSPVPAGIRGRTTPWT